MHSVLALILVSFALVKDVPADKPSPLRLLAFYGQGCRPCLEMRPILKRLESEGAKIERIDVGDKKQAGKWRVNRIPTFVAIGRSGKEAGRITGKTTIERLRQLLGRKEPSQVLPKPSEKPEQPKPSRSLLRRKR